MANQVCHLREIFLANVLNESYYTFKFVFFNPHYFNTHFERNGDLTKEKFIGVQYGLEPVEWLKLNVTVMLNKGKLRYVIKFHFLANTILDFSFSN